MSAPQELTMLLLAARDGGNSDREALFGAVYDELRVLARIQRRRHAADSTLHTTALVHESYLKLVDQENLADGDRLRFFGIAASAMRHILVDHYRTRSAKKRGGDQEQVDLDPNELATAAHGEMLLDLDQALIQLAQKDDRQARVVELRFFAGLNDQEIANIVGVSDRTVRKDWQQAKVWLADLLSDEMSHPDE